MAKNESTAVNELLQRMATMTPLRPDPSDDLMFRAPPPPAHGSDVVPLPRNRAANGTPIGTMTMQGVGGRSVPPMPPAGQPAAAMTMQGLGPVVQRALAASEAGEPGPRRPARTPLPLPAPAMPAAPARISQPQPIQADPAFVRSSQLHPAQVLEAPPVQRRAATPAPRAMPVAAPFESGAMPVAGRTQPAAGLEAPSRAWFEHAHAQSQLEHVPHEEEWVGTLQLNRRRRTGSRAGKLILPLLAVTVAVAGALAGGYIALYRQDGASSAPAASVAATPAAIPAAATAPASAAPAAPVARAAVAAPAFVDVLIVSSPAGATVTLVDRGRTSFLGTTPISTALDPSRKYELMFSQPGKSTWVEPLDPSATRRVDVKLGATTSTPAAPAAARPRAERQIERAAAPAPAAEKVAPAAEKAAPAAEKAVAAPAAEKAVAAPAGEGVLMLASKPPCEIFVNGKATGLMTPQREIRLPAGRHKITLLNEAEKIKKTISVQIEADKATKVIQDLMPQ